MSVNIYNSVLLESKYGNIMINTFYSDFTIHSILLVGIWLGPDDGDRFSEVFLQHQDKFMLEKLKKGHKIFIYVHYEDDILVAFNQNIDNETEDMLKIFIQWPSQKPDIYQWIWRRQHNKCPGPYCDEERSWKTSCRKLNEANKEEGNINHKIHRIYQQKSPAFIDDIGAKILKKMKETLQSNNFKSRTWRENTFSGFDFTRSVTQNIGNRFKM